MAVFPGSTFQRPLPGGQSVTYTVRAVRFGPVPYAEVEPVGGGAREALSMWTVERMQTNCLIGDADPMAGPAFGAEHTAAISV